MSASGSKDHCTRTVTEYRPRCAVVRIQDSGEDLCSYHQNAIGDASGDQPGTIGESVYES
jgi:hypothetical protein